MTLVLFCNSSFWNYPILVVLRGPGKRLLIDIRKAARLVVKKYSAFFPFIEPAFILPVDKTPIYVGTISDWWLVTGDWWKTRNGWKDYRRKVRKVEKRCAEEVSKSSDSMPVSPKLASQAVLAKPPYNGTLHRGCPNCPECGYVTDGRRC